MDNPERIVCEAITKKGTRCKRYAEWDRYGMLVCHIHRFIDPPDVPPCPVKCGAKRLPRPFQCMHQYEAWRDQMWTTSSS